VKNEVHLKNPNLRGDNASLIILNLLPNQFHQTVSIDLFSCGLRVPFELKQANNLHPQLSTWRQNNENEAHDSWLNALKQKEVGYPFDSSV